MTSKVGTALNDALDKSDGETSSSVKSSLDSVGDAITSFDKESSLPDPKPVSLFLPESSLVNELPSN